MNLSTHFYTFFNQSMTWRDACVFAGLSAFLQLFVAELLLPTHLPAWYQFFTGHWVHLNWLHWGLNMAVLLCLPFLLPVVARKYFWLLVVFLPPVISYILVYTEQLQAVQVASYVGFSGVLHGIYLFFSLFFLWHGLFEKTQLTTQLPPYFRWQALVLAVGVIAKVMLEKITMPMTTANMLKATVVHDAHADGVGVALIVFCVYLIFRVNNSRVEAQRRD